MILHLLVVHIILLCGFLCTKSLLAQTGPKIIDKAKQEGRVVYYTPLNVTAANVLIKSFEKEYPYLRVQLLRQGGEALRTRVLSEAQAGRHNFDVISMNILDAQLLQRRELLAPYISTERGGIPQGLKDREGFWTASYIIQHVIGYNSRLVPAGKIPRDWRDLLDPIWKGKIGLDRDGVVWYASLLQYWGRERGVKFMKQLSVQEPHFERGNTLRTQMMAAGEFPLAVVHAHKVEEFKTKRAPIDWVTTSNPIITHGNIVSIARHAPHPNAARLFVDYFLSKKGQIVLNEAFVVPARTDIPPLAPSLDQSKLNVHYVDPVLAENYNQYQKEYQEIFQ